MESFVSSGSMPSMPVLLFRRPRHFCGPMFEDYYIFRRPSEDYAYVVPLLNFDPAS